MLQQRRQARVRPLHRCFVGIAQTEAVQLPAVGGHDLNADGPSLWVEAPGDGQAGAAGHRDEQVPFHPFVVGLHGLTGNAVGPMEVCGEWECLGRRQDEEVVALEKGSHDFVPLRASDGSCRDVVGRQGSPVSTS